MGEIKARGGTGFGSADLEIVVEKTGVHCERLDIADLASEVGGIPAVVCLKVWIICERGFAGNVAGEVRLAGVAGRSVFEKCVFRGAAVDADAVAGSPENAHKFGIVVCRDIHTGTGMRFLIAFEYRRDCTRSIRKPGDDGIVGTAG